MRSSLLGGLAIVTTLLLAGCGLLSSAQEDESIGWSAQRLYGEAKDAMNAKEWQKAIKFLEKLEARYPYGRYAQQAQLEVAYAQYKDNERASHEVHVARYYMKRGAYLAAANRVQYAIRNYPQAPAIEEAVYILARAYDALGMTDLRDAADRVMHTNFPDSRYLKPDSRRRSAPWWRIWDPDW